MRFLRTPRAPYVPGLNRTYFWQVGTDSEEIETMLLRPGTVERYATLSSKAAVDPMGGSIHIRPSFFLGNATARDRTTVPDWLGITIQQAPPTFEFKIDKTKLSHAATGLHGITVTLASDYQPEVFGDSRSAWGLSAPATAYRTLLNITYVDIPKQEKEAREVKTETKVVTRKKVLTGEPVEAYLESISAQGLVTIGFNQRLAVPEVVRLWREQKFNSGKSDQAKSGEKGASEGEGKEAKANNLRNLNSKASNDTKVKDWLVLQSIMAVEILSADAGDEDFVPPRYNYTLKTWQP